MSIRRFKRADDGALDPEATRLMGEAFDAVCAPFASLSKNDQEAVADRIVKAARSGERDPIRLRDAGMAALKRA